MNAITPIAFADTLHAEHLADLRELREATKAIARKAVERTLEALENPPPTRPSIDAMAIFAKAGLTLTRIVAAEARLLAPAARTSRAATAPARPHAFDEPTKLARAALHRAANETPDRAARARLRQEIDTRLAESQGSGVPLREQFDTICDEMDLAIDWSQQPDELLDALIGPEYRDPELTPEQISEMVRNCDRPKSNGAAR